VDELILVAARGEHPMILRDGGRLRLYGHVWPCGAVR
jgi:hypothetical protein